MLHVRGASERTGGDGATETETGQGYAMGASKTETGQGYGVDTRSQLLDRARFNAQRP